MAIKRTLTVYIAIQQLIKSWSCFNSQSVISQSLTCQQHADCDLPHVSGGYRVLSARHCRSFSCLQFISPPIEVGESLLYLVKFMQIFFEQSDRSSHEYPEQYLYLGLPWKDYRLCTKQFLSQNYDCTFP